MGIRSYQDLEVLGYIDENKFSEMVEKTAEIGKLLNGLRKSVAKTAGT